MLRFYDKESCYETMFSLHAFVGCIVWCESCYGSTNANLPFYQKQLAKTIKDVHFYLVYDLDYVKQPGKTFRRGEALMPDQYGHQMLIWQKPLFYNHPFRSVKVIQNPQSGRYEVAIHLYHDDAAELAWISHRFPRKYLAITQNKTHMVCGDGKPGAPAVTSYSASHVISVANMMSAMSGDFIITGLSQAATMKLAKELKAGIYKHY